MSDIDFLGLFKEIRKLSPEKLKELKEKLEKLNQRKKTTMIKPRAKPPPQRKDDAILP